MSSQDIQQLASRYLGHLLTTPEARAEYAAADKTDFRAMGALIQKHLQLAQAPSESDVKAAFQHATTLCQPILDAFKQHAPQFYEMATAGLIIFLKQE